METLEDRVDKKSPIKWPRYRWYLYIMNHLRFWLLCLGKVTIGIITLETHTYMVGNKERKVKIINDSFIAKGDIWYTTDWWKYHHVKWNTGNIVENILWLW
jgi:hypothetical protein